MLRFSTAGESHGESLVALVSGMPAGVPIENARVNRELWRRQQGYGRGGRMRIEQDTAHFLSGVRHGKTIGSPIAIEIENRDWKNWTESLPVAAGDPAKHKAVASPRPGHADLAGAPPHVAGDFPEWLAPQFEASFGAFAAVEGRALAERAPLDLRVNLLKATRDKALAALSYLAPEPTPFSPVGLRIAMRPDGRAPPLASDPAYVKGLVEVQDEGSQLGALLAEARAGMQVLDLCAGAGGKTLALAAAMANQGQIYAADDDARRIAPIFARLARSGARNVQVRAPRGREDVLADLEGRYNGVKHSVDVDK